MTEPLTIDDWLIEEGGLDLSVGADPDEVARRMQQLAADGPAQLWSFRVDMTERGSNSLLAGLSQEVGALSWWDGQRGYHPVNSSNAQPVDYWMAGHHTQLRNGTEVPAADVLAAVREFLTTGRRPTCIEWLARGQE